MYSLSLGIFLINNKKYVLCGSQYHSSKGYSTFRKAQFHATLNILLDMKENHGVNDFIWASDFNYDINRPEKWSEAIYMNQLLKRYNLGNVWNDAWVNKYPNKPGYTEDTEVNEMRKYMKGNLKRIKAGIKKFNLSTIKAENKQVRFDAILYNGKTLKVHDIEVIGTQGKVVSGYKVWPSDHFGLFATLSLTNQTKKSKKKNLKKPKKSLENLRENLNQFYIKMF